MRRKSPLVGDAGGVRPTGRARRPERFSGWTVMDGRGSSTVRRLRARALGLGFACLRLQQAMDVDYEIAHLRVIDARLRCRPPGRMRRLVIGIHADDVELGEVLELDLVRRNELAAENQMEKLLWFVLGHHVYPGGSLRSRTRSSSFACNAGPAATIEGCSGSRPVLGSASPRGRGARPPASCTMGSAAARSQSCLAESAIAASKAPQATSASR